MLLPGIEPGALVPQTNILSIKLQERSTASKAAVASYLKIQKIPVPSGAVALGDALQPNAPA